MLKYIQGGPKNGTICVHLIFLPNINQFSIFSLTDVGDNL